MMMIVSRSSRRVEGRCRGRKGLHCRLLVLLQVLLEVPVDVWSSGWSINNESVVCRLPSILAIAPQREARTPQPALRSRVHDIHHTTAGPSTCHHTHPTSSSSFIRSLAEPCSRTVRSSPSQASPSSPPHSHSTMLPRVSRLAVLLPTAITHTTVCKKICAVTSSRRRPRQDNPPLLPQSLSGLGGGGGRSISTTLPTAAPAPKRAGGGGGPRGKSPNNLAKER